MSCRHTTEIKPWKLMSLQKPRSTEPEKGTEVIFRAQQVTRRDAAAACPLHGTVCLTRSPRGHEGHQWREGEQLEPCRHRFVKFSLPARLSAQALMQTSTKEEIATACGEQWMLISAVWWFTTSLTLSFILWLILGCKTPKPLHKYTKKSSYRTFILPFSSREAALYMHYV